jgi:hypothetical protein
MKTHSTQLIWRVQDENGDGPIQNGAIHDLAGIYEHIEDVSRFMQSDNRSSILNGALNSGNTQNQAKARLFLGHGLVNNIDEIRSGITHANHLVRYFGSFLIPLLVDYRMQIWALEVPRLLVLEHIDHQVLYPHVEDFYPTRSFLYYHRDPQIMISNLERSARIWRPKHDI